MLRRLNLLLGRLSSPLRISLVYAVLGGVWIVFSDHVVTLWVRDVDTITFIATLKGWVYVLVTAAILYVLIRRDIAALEHSQKQLQHSYDATLEGWARALDLRDKETENHTLRVTQLALAIAEQMGASPCELEAIRRGALLHDIGKMGIPDSILLKPDRLTDEEWAIMRRHPTYAYELLSPITYLKSALEIPYCHHEKWDGSGYPRGLRGDQIPLAARIFAVADVWDALGSDRPYRQAWQPERMIAHIQAGTGTHFDPQVVQVFMRVVRIA